MAGQFRELPIRQLRLDPKNPRLPRELPAGESTDDSLLRHFARNYNLIELARSMADKGFTPREAEALLVVEEPQDSGNFVVVEGNRRLATLLLLTDADRRAALAMSAEWKELAREATGKGHTFDPVPAIVYDDRKDLDEYLGFRHITGPAQWRPEAKARFIAALLENGRSIVDVARRIGSNTRTIRRYAEAHAIYEQLLSESVDITPVEAAFGVFYNALDTQGVRSYLGLQPQYEMTSLPHSPVRRDHIERLLDLIGFLYGDEEKKLERVIRESRDLKHLGEALQDDTATAILLRTRDLKRAYRVAGGGKTDLMAILRDSLVQLREANGQAYEFKSDGDVRESVRRLVELVSDMEKRYELKDE